MPSVDMNIAVLTCQTRASCASGSGRSYRLTGITTQTGSMRRENLKETKNEGWKYDKSFMNDSPLGDWGVQWTYRQKLLL
jgi:hypothetical protein